MSSTLIQHLNFCFDHLDNLLLPVLENKNLKDKVIKQISSNSIMDELEKQTIESSKKG